MCAHILDPPEAPLTDAARLSADIVAIGRHQDREAFARLFRHFAPRIKSFLKRQGVPPARTEDLVQEVLLTVWRKAALYDPARAEPATWIFTIARNLRIDALRRERHPEVSDEVLAEHEDGRPGADERVADGQRTQRLARALAELSPEQVEVVRLSFFADIAHGGIADRLGLPLGTVKSRLRLAMVKMRKALGEDIP